MSGFERRGTSIRASFDAGEAALLSSLLDQVASLLETRDEYRGDAALDRLLPAAYRDDSEAAEEFRRFTEAELADRKSAAARSAATALAAPVGADGLAIELSPGEATAWATAFTDLRLTLAARLGIDNESPEVPHTDDPDDPAGALASVYEWLGYLLESLMVALDDA